MYMCMCVCVCMCTNMIFYILLGMWTFSCVVSIHLHEDIYLKLHLLDDLQLGTQTCHHPPLPRQRCPCSQSCQEWVCWPQDQANEASGMQQEHIWRVLLIDWLQSWYYDCICYHCFSSNCDKMYINMVVAGGSVVMNLPGMQKTRVPIPGLGRSSGEGNGKPLQYSCLVNPLDRGAWRATDHGLQTGHDWWLKQHIHTKRTQITKWPV